MLFVRLKARSRAAYRELVHHDDENRFLRFERRYTSPPDASARIVLTRDRRVAERWQMTDGSLTMWRQFRRQTHGVRREILTLPGRYFGRSKEADVNALAMDLVARWRMPSAPIECAKEIRTSVWGTQDSEIASS